MESGKFETPRKEKGENPNEILSTIEADLAGKMQQEDRWSVSADKGERVEIVNMAEEMIYKVNDWKAILSARNAEKILESSEENAILRRFMNPKFLHSLILMRGDFNRFIELIPNFLDVVVKKETGGKGLARIEPRKIMELLDENNFSPEVINYLMSAYFHLGRKEEFDRLGQTILENESTVDPLVILTCKMDMNSMRTKNGEKLLFNPKDVSQETLRRGDFSLAMKTIYGGLLENREINFRDKIERFMLMSKLFRKLGNFQDASRAQTEAALLMFDHIDINKKYNEKEQVLKNMKNISVNILKDASRVNYAVGVICGQLIKWLVFKGRKELIAERTPDTSNLSPDKQAAFQAMGEGEDSSARQLKKLIETSLYIPPRFSQYSQLSRLH